jgi:5S rRNA maturation endonuclease (ribonuclease M5)
MSNKYVPHLLVIPEDEANRQIITGFASHSEVDNRRIHVEPVACGWIRALEHFQSNHLRGMKKYENRHVMILIDFDDREDRLEKAKEYIPENMRSRVYVMGCLSEPERIRAATRMSKSQFGEAIAEACLSGNEDLWQKDILAHNRAELERMKSSICPHIMLHGPRP